MIILNLGSKYIIQDFGTILDYLFSIKLVKRIILFTIFFVATRDTKTSIILTGIIVITTLELFNEKSYNCIIPKKWLDYIKKSNKKKNDTNEINHALTILRNKGLIN